MRVEFGMHSILWPSTELDVLHDIVSLVSCLYTIKAALIHTDMANVKLILAGSVEEYTSTIQVVCQKMHNMAWGAWV